MNNDFLGLMGLCLRAGRIAIGDDATGDYVDGGYARAIFVTGDAGENALKKANSYAQRANIPVLKLPCTKAELGGALGRAACALCCVSDAGLAAAIAARVATESGQNLDAAQRLDQNSQRILKRRGRAKPEKTAEPPDASKDSDVLQAQKRSPGKAYDARRHAEGKRPSREQRVYDNKKPHARGKTDYDEHNPKEGLPKSYSDRKTKPYGNRASAEGPGEGKTFGARKPGNGGRSFSSNGKPYGNRTLAEGSGEGKTFGARKPGNGGRSFSSNGKPYGNRFSSGKPRSDKHPTGRNFSRKSGGER